MFVSVLAVSRCVSQNFSVNGIKTKVPINANNITNALNIPNCETGGNAENASVVNPKPSASDVVIIGFDSCLMVCRRESNWDEPLSIRRW